MSNKYYIAVNELYSLLEWFIIEKLLIKKGRVSQKHGHSHRCAENCTRNGHLTESQKEGPKS